MGHWRLGLLAIATLLAACHSSSAGFIEVTSSAGGVMPLAAKMLNSSDGKARLQVTINANNTWSNGQGYSGTWVQVAGILTFQFNNSKTIYSGNFADKSVTGVNTTFSVLNGSFYMLEAGAGAAPTAQQRSHRIADSAGQA